MEMESNDLSVYFKSLFASKGYKFEPSENGQNLFTDKEGLVYGQDYIEDLLMNGRF